MLPALLTLLVVADIAPRPLVVKPAPPLPTAECVADGDCVLSTFAGCCPSCCGGDVHAVKRGTNESARCAAIDCALPDCSALRCRAPPKPEDFVAKCEATRCVAVPRGNECRADADCQVVTFAPPEAACHQSACGCCPVTRAAPRDAPVPLQKRQGGKQGPAPQFGLSTGESPAPTCAPCPAPQRGTARCSAGRCVLKPRVPPAG